MTLLGSVAICPESEHGFWAGGGSGGVGFADFATNENAAREGGASRTMAVVAGTGFEPVTFRL